MAAQFPDRVTAVASHLEWGLIWDMQKMIIKAGPAAQLAEHHRAAREQVFLSLTPGALAGLGKGNGEAGTLPKHDVPSQAVLAQQSGGRPARCRAQHSFGNITVTPR